jgi:hypothetical protein
MTLIAVCDIDTRETVMPGLVRASTSSFSSEKDVDGRNKSGHDE